MKKIAVVEDDEHIGNMLAELLRGEGYETVRAYSGSEALLLLERARPISFCSISCCPGRAAKRCWNGRKTFAPSSF